MQKTILVEVDQSTWPPPPQLPAYPATFPTSQQNYPLDILPMLLLLGTITTPPLPSGLSLSEHWAWIRYLYAVSQVDTDLRLSAPFAELDAHQKTILSDDFGMAVPMFWLSQHLNLGLPTDGKFFIDRLSILAPGAIAQKTSKRGPQKSPDFVSEDSFGVWHVVECKGTQSGSRARRKQIGVAGPPSTGAIAQKSTIKFPVGHTGQRLATGLCLAFTDAPSESSLMIRDPEPTDDVSLSEDDLHAGTDAVIRSNVARGLVLAGFVDAASVIAAPSGRTTREQMLSKLDSERTRFVREKRRKAREELSDLSNREIITEGGEEYRGRRVRIDLPSPLQFDGKEIVAVEIEQAVNKQVLDELANSSFSDEAIQLQDTGWRQTVGPTKLGSDLGIATLDIGTYFHSRIKLEE